MMSRAKWAKLLINLKLTSIPVAQSAPFSSIYFYAIPGVTIMREAEPARSINRVGTGARRRSLFRDR
jgi:hypothetical protein